MSLKYHIGTYQYCQPIKARHNIQELIMNWPFQKIKQREVLSCVPYLGIWSALPVEFKDLSIYYGT